MTVVLLSFLLIMSIFIILNFENTSKAQTPLDVYVGVDMGYGGWLNSSAATATAKTLIDQVYPYTNLFVVGTTGISNDARTLNDTLQYAYDKGLSFISFIPPYFWIPYDSNYSLRVAQWCEDAKNTWGDKMLGFLCPTQIEPGGQQLDLWPHRLVSISNTVLNVSGYPRGGYYFNSSDYYVCNYTEAAPKFENQLSSVLNRNSLGVNRTVFPLFTSDYTLYWFDYKGGYDGSLRSSDGTIVGS